MRIDRPCLQCLGLQCALALDRVGWICVQLFHLPSLTLDHWLCPLHLDIGPLVTFCRQQVVIAGRICPLSDGLQPSRLSPLTDITGPEFSTG